MVCGFLFYASAYVRTDAASLAAAGALLSVDAIGFVWSVVDSKVKYVDSRVASHHNLLPPCRRLNRSSLSLSVDMSRCTRQSSKGKEA